MSDDLRPADMKRLGESLNKLWTKAWEGIEGLHNEMHRTKDSTQNAWHLSRLSFLAGYRAGLKAQRAELVEKLEAMIKNAQYNFDNSIGYVKVGHSYELEAYRNVLEIINGENKA